MSVRLNRAAMLIAGAAVMAAGSVANADFAGRMFAMTVQLQDPSTGENIGAAETFEYWFQEGSRGVETVTATTYNWGFDSLEGTDAAVVMHGGTFTIDSARLRLVDTTINPLTAGGGGTLSAEADFSVTNASFANAVITAVSNNETAAAAISNAQGRASSSIQGQDFGGNGFSLAPFGPAGYQAFYNGAAAGTGSVFAAHHASALTAPAFDGNSATANTPGPSNEFGAVGASVSSISASFGFTLGNFNTASGTSVFEVLIPTPGSMALLGLGGIAAIRRRR
jgi:hypothetical protein